MEGGELEEDLQVIHLSIIQDIRKIQKLSTMTLVSLPTREMSLQWMTA